MKKGKIPLTSIILITILCTVSVLVFFTFRNMNSGDSAVKVDYSLEDDRPEGMIRP